MKKAAQDSDLDIIHRVINGEPQLYELLIRKYNSYLYKVGRAQRYSHEDTQDLMQETYVDAFTHLAKFENHAAFKTWIVKIMVNNCFRERKKWSFKNIISTEINESSVPIFLNSDRLDIDKTIMNEELKAVIEEALLRIPEDYRMVFIMREVNALKVKETAEVLSITEANVKVRLTRAKAMLRKEVEKSYSAQEIFEFNLIYCDALVEKVMHTIRQLKL